ncbi:MAG: 1-acyl-sn-glycerol-3-phosphate acyltransferase, partial [Actinomycetales bacterium]
MQEKRSWAWRIAEPIVRAALVATTKREWVGGEHIPATGGCILVLNHVSHVDPLTAAHLVYDHGRLPHYLAKSGLFRNKAMGAFFRAAGQIPVERLSKNAAGAFDAAVEAVNEGKCVVVYPEGTITRDPAGWPMTGKSGAARIALETGCPVIPVGQWGAQELLAPYAKMPDLFPRKLVKMTVGTSIPLDDLRTQERSITT